MTRQREKGRVTITRMMEAMIRSLATTLGASSHTPGENMNSASSEEQPIVVTLFFALKHPAVT